MAAAPNPVLDNRPIQVVVVANPTGTLTASGTVLPNLTLDKRPMQVCVLVNPDGTLYSA